MNKKNFIPISLLIILNYSTVWAGWTLQTVDSTGEVGRYISVKVDRNNNVHISYMDITNKDLKYAKQFSTGSWITQTIDSIGDIGYYTSIAVDSNNNPHIAYYDATNKDLKYAKFSSINGWTIQTVESVGDVGSFTSIVIDSSGNPHIAYRGNAGILKYTRCLDGNWSSQVIDSDGSFWDISLKLDSNNVPHISYYNDTLKDLKYVKWTGSLSSKEIVDSSGEVGEYSSLALDSDNNPHISYYDNTYRNLKYARYLSTSGWIIQTIDSTDEVGKYTSITISTDSYVNISYVNFTNNHFLKYARWTGVNWLINTVDTSGDVGDYSSIAFDQNNYIYISYLNNSDYDLKCAKWTNNMPVLGWSGETGFINDGLSPELGNNNTTFTFRIRYTDIDNDAPLTGYPRVHIKKNGVEISNSPFTMTTTDSNQYTAGKVYFYATLIPSGTDYAYYFDAKDNNGLLAIGVPTGSVDAPDVSTMSFIVTGKVSKSDGVTAFSGVVIEAKQDGQTKYSTTTATNGNYTMELPVGEYNLVFATVTYTAITRDLNITANQTLTINIVFNKPPTLFWTGEQNYISSGLYPETGTPYSNFRYRIKYNDPEGDTPKLNYPKVHILKGGTEINNSPFNMLKISGDYQTGAIFEYIINLSTGTDYTYYFEAYDIIGDTATGTPTTTVIDMPDVLNITKTIRGYVKNSTGVGIPAIPVNLSGDLSDSVTTDSRGGYELTILAGGDYTVFPSSKDWVFNPVNITYSSLNADVDNQNFVGTSYGYVAGRVTCTVDTSGLAGCVVEAWKSNTVICSTTCDNNGEFALRIVPNIYDVKISSVGHITYTKTGVTVVYSSTYTINTYLLKQTYSISGFVRDTAGFGLRDATVILSGSSNTVTTTNINGVYSFQNLYNGDYTITVSKKNYYFTPEKISFSSLAINKSNQNFIGTTVVFHIKGAIIDSNGIVVNEVTLTLTGDKTDTKKTISLGRYEFVNLFAGNYIVTPSGRGYTFYPASMSFPDLKSNLEDQNFVAAELAPEIGVDTTVLDFGELKKGEIKSLAFNISNKGGKTLSGNISSNRNWVTVNPTSFSANDKIITVIVDNNILDKGDGQYSGTLDITSNGGDSAVLVKVKATCVLIYPNPYSLSSGKRLTFWGSGVVPFETKIKIYSLGMDLIKTVEERDGKDVLYWDGTNEFGERVVPGIYFYVSESPKEHSVGRITAIK